MNNQESKIYKVSKQSEKFIAALEMLQKTESQFLNALQDLYGDEQGDAFFHQSLDDGFNKAEGWISRFLAQSICLNLGDYSAKGMV